MKFFIFCITLFLCMNINAQGKNIYINNSVTQQGDGSFEHPFWDAKDIPRAISTAGENGSITIYGTGKTYQLPETLILLHGQTLTGTKNQLPILAGNIKIVSGNILMHLNLVNKKEGNPMGICGTDLKNITLDNLHVGTKDPRSSEAFHYGIYFDTSGLLPDHQHIRIINTIALAADNTSTQGIIGITIGEEYNDVVIENSYGFAREENKMPDVITNVIGILSAGNHVLIKNTEGIAEITGAVSGMIQGLQLKGSFVTVLNSKAQANTIGMDARHIDLFTTGIYSAGEHFILDHTLGKSSVTQGTVEDTNDGIHIDHTDNITLIDCTFNAKGIYPHAIFLDNQANVILKRSVNSQGWVSVGNSNENQIAISGFGKLLLLRNGEQWRFPVH